MSRSGIFVIVLFIAVAVFAPLGASAAQVPEFSGPIVPCGVSGGDDTGPSDTGPLSCQACHLLTLAQNVINFIIFLATIAAVLMFVYAGFLYITAVGDSGKIKQAHTIFTNVAIGFVIVLASWLIIDTVMKAFLDEDKSKFGPWNEILCKTPTKVPASGTSAQQSSPGIVGVVDCSDDQALMDNYKGSPVGLEDSDLTTMVKCYTDDPSIAEVIDTGQIFTTDQSHPRCSLTNGNTVCGACSHSVSSCHYGSGTGKGAMAVDFNANLSKISEPDLFKLLQKRQATCGGTPLYETRGNSAHTHISINACPGT